MRILRRLEAGRGECRRSCRSREDPGRLPLALSQPISLFMYVHVLVKPFCPASKSLALKSLNTHHPIKFQPSIRQHRITIPHNIIASTFCLQPQPSHLTRGLIPPNPRAPDNILKIAFFKHSAILILKRICLKFSHLHTPTHTPL